MTFDTHLDKADVVLIGSGIMSANLGAMLKCLEPRLKIQVYEVTEGLAQESSQGWNNAGTGHAGICELSYTPTRDANGVVNVGNAIEIFELFEQSRQFWAYAVARGIAETPREFVNPVPHLSFVHGAEMVDFLRSRYEGLKRHHFFQDMEFTTDGATVAQWAPLLMRDRAEMPVAATRMMNGTDMNFGALARKLIGWLARQGCGVASNHRVVDLKRADAGWEVSAKNLATGEVRVNTTKFVFVGAGGGSLALLQKSGIPEARGLGGFPVGGHWLVCDNPEIIREHQAKVYGHPQPEAPTLAVPHLDTRVLDGRKTLLFGPFGAWTTRFLHGKGSPLDLPRSIRPDNLFTLLNVGLHNLDLVRFLIQQGTQSMADRLAVLRDFYPAARAGDWKLVDAGIRVQAIKKTDGRAGIVHTGTEVISSEDRTISALLGASPGASVSVSIVLNVLKTCFPHLLESAEGRARMKEMIPTYDEDLKQPESAERYREVSQQADALLQLAPGP